MSSISTETEPSCVRGVSRLAHDFIELGELQAVLLTLDMKKASRLFRATVVAGAVALAALLATFPIALFSLAELFVEQFQWGNAFALAISALVGLAVSAALAGGAWICFRRSLRTFDRSRDELQRNVAWLKTWLRDDSLSSTSNGRHTVPR